MDRQRLIRCPPNPELMDLENPFAKVPAYEYSQLTFKTFSDDEIKNQAGRESLPKVDAFARLEGTSKVRGE